MAYHVSKKLYATDKAVAGEVAGVWVNSQTSSNQQTGGTRVVANNFLLINPAVKGLLAGWMRPAHI